jgi:hypothetical protein
VAKVHKGYIAIERESVHAVKKVNENALTGWDGVDL